MNQTILLLNGNDTDEYVGELMDLVGPSTAADADAVVAADGADLETENGSYASQRTANNNAKLAAQTAVRKKNAQKKKAIAAYNKAARKVMEKYPDDVKKWAALGYPVSKKATDRKPCKKITGGKAVQWIHDGFVDLSWKSLGTEADFYTIDECQGDSTVEANWYPANPAQCKEAGAIIKPKKLNVPTWYRATGHNTAGAGVAPSDPIGGKPIY